MRQLRAREVRHGICDVYVEVPVGGMILVEVFLGRVERINKDAYKISTLDWCSPEPATDIEFALHGVDGVTFDTVTVACEHIVDMWRSPGLRPKPGHYT